MAETKQQLAIETSRLSEAQLARLEEAAKLRGATTAVESGRIVVDVAKGIAAEVKHDVVNAFADMMGVPEQCWGLPTGS